MSTGSDANVAVRSNDPPSQRPSSEATRGRVLVVDDDEGIRRVLRRALDDHDVVTANDGVAALAMLGPTPGFDVILCDVVMPNMGGVEFWAAVARSRPDVLDRIVFMTGGALTLEEESFLSAGHAVVIRKPFSFDELRRFVAARVEARLSQ